MGRIIVSEFLTLNGVMEEPMWSLTYWNEDIAKFKHDELFSVDSLLLGRVTYEGFASSWPQRSGDDFSDRINSMKKYVVTSTLNQLDWSNSQKVTGNVLAEIAAIKQREPGDILIFGSDQLVQSLIGDNLVDQYNLLVYPLVLGKGKRFLQGGPETTLKLTESKSYDTGAVLLVYEPLPKA